MAGRTFPYETVHLCDGTSFRDQGLESFDIGESMNKSSQKVNPVEQQIFEAILLDGATEVTVGSPKKRKTRVKKPKTGTQSFADIKETLTHRNKPVQAWNKKDLRQYFASRYMEMFSTEPLFQTIAFYTAVKEISSKIGQRMNQKEASIEMVKGYFDFYYEEHISKMVAKYECFLLKFLSYDSIIDAFVKRVKSKQSVEATVVKTVDEPVIPQVVNELEKAVEEAAKVIYRSVVLSYGLVIAVNYAVAKKGVALDKAVKGVAELAVKACKSDKKFWLNIVAATEKYGPYPKTLAWVDVTQITALVKREVGQSLKEMKVELVDENPSLNFLRKV